MIRLPKSLTSVYDKPPKHPVNVSVLSSFVFSDFTSYCETRTYLIRTDTETLQKCWFIPEKCDFESVNTLPLRVDLFSVCVCLSTAYLFAWYPSHSRTHSCCGDLITTYNPLQWAWSEPNLIVNETPRRTGTTCLDLTHVHTTAEETTEPISFSLGAETTLQQHYVTCKNEQTLIPSWLYATATSMLTLQNILSEWEWKA